MSHVTLLRKALAASGLTHAAFAARVLGRSRSTLTKWLSGDRPIPAPVVTRLKEYLTSPKE